MDIRRIFSDAGMSTVRILIGIGSGIVLIPIITRWVGESAYGIWATIISLVSLLSMAGGMHLHGSLIRYSTGEPSDRTLVNVLALSTLSGGGASVIILSGAIIYNLFIGFNSLSVDLLVPAAILVFAKIINSPLMNYPRALQEVKRYESLVLLRDGIEIIVLVTIFWQSKSIILALWGIVASTLMINAVLLIFFWPNLKTLPKPSDFRKYLQYGVPMIPKEISGSLLHNADKFLVLYFLGPVSTGVYAATYAVTNLLPQLTGVFNSTLYPNIMESWDRNETDELSNFYSEFLRWYTVFAIPATAGLFLLAEPILLIISTPQIASTGAILVPILASASLFQALESVLSYPLAAVEETRRLAEVSITAVLLNIVLNILLIPSIGLIGAALATLVAFGLRTVILYKDASKHIRISSPTHGGARAGVATIFMWLMLSSLPIHTWYSQLVLYPLVGIVCFCISFIIIGGIKADEWNFLRRKLRN
jgi:O-antigen/teichoic acid export membrane protein